MVLIGQLTADESAIRIFFSPLQSSFRLVLNFFIFLLWIAFLTGAIAMAWDRYWGRWVVALSSILLAAELVNFEVLPELARGWNNWLSTMSVTWPGFTMGRGPASLVILIGLSGTIILKGLARRPSSVRRGNAGEFLRTRETD